MVDAHLTETIVAKPKLVYNLWAAGGRQRHVAANKYTEVRPDKPTTK
jgi:hypothetical protein